MRQSVVSHSLRVQLASTLAVVMLCLGNLCPIFALATGDGDSIDENSYKKRRPPDPPALRETIDQALIALHVQAPSSKAPCGHPFGNPLPAFPNFKTNGPVQTGQFVYVMAVAESAGIGGISLGISYTDSLGVFDWQGCSTLEFPNPGWPASGTGIRSTWLATTSAADLCDRTLVDGANTRVAGHFYVYAYGKSRMEITEHPNLESGPELKIASCTSWETDLPLSAAGKAGFGYDGSSQCAPVLPVFGGMPVPSDSALAAPPTWRFIGLIRDAGLGSRAPVRWLDPPTVFGYRYTMTSSSVFTAIRGFPTGFSAPFEVSVDTVSLGTFSPGDSTIFADYAAQLGSLLVGDGVVEFTVTGISPLVDPSDPLGFPLGIDFDTPTADLVMTAIDYSVTADAQDRFDRLATLGAANYPNPFSARTMIRFRLDDSEAVSLDIFDIQGRRIRSLAASEPFASGDHTLAWDGRDNLGGNAPSGVYFYRIQAGSLQETQRMILVR